jgi:peptidoglycan hydrolase-like protein with peptidoglycan-binding domain
VCSSDLGGFGYHYLIEFDGTIREGRGLEFIPAAQKGYNTGTIAICLQGLNLLDFTPDQFRAMKRLIHRIVTATPHGGLSSRVRIRGHREVANKTCPVFNYRGILDLNAEGFLSRKGVDALAASWYDGPAVEKKDEDPVEFTTVTAGAWRERVRAFQRANNLEVDGNVGPATWSVIETYLKQLEI